jgi:hypothetical protein
MKNCVIYVGIPEDAGRELGFRGMRDHVVVAQENRLQIADEDIHDHGDDPDQRAFMRSSRLFFCDARDVPLVVDRISKEWVGHEIKVFNVDKVFQRNPGDMVEKKITKDGVLPV